MLPPQVAVVGHVDDQRVVEPSGRLEGIDDVSDVVVHGEQRPVLILPEQVDLAPRSGIQTRLGLDVRRLVRHVGLVVAGRSPLRDIAQRLLVPDRRGCGHMRGERRVIQEERRRLVRRLAVSDCRILTRTVRRFDAAANARFPVQRLGAGARLPGREGDRGSRLAGTTRP